MRPTLVGTDIVPTAVADVNMANRSVPEAPQKLKAPTQWELSAGELAASVSCGSQYFFSFFVSIYKRIY